MKVCSRHALMDIPAAVWGCPDCDPRPDGALGPCGCIDYHYGDCPLRQPYAEADDFESEWDERNRWLDDECDDDGCDHDPCITGLA